MSKTNVIPFRVDNKTYNYLKAYTKEYNMSISSLMRCLAETFVQNMRCVDIKNDAAITYRRLTGLT